MTKYLVRFRLLEIVKNESYWLRDLKRTSEKTRYLVCFQLSELVKDKLSRFLLKNFINKEMNE